MVQSSAFQFNFASLFIYGYFLSYKKGTFQRSPQALQSSMEPGEK
jgi:hypothetical protein